MSKDIKRFVESCDNCQKNKSHRHAPIGQLNSLPIPQRPFDFITMDFITGLPESKGYNAILVVVDRFLKMGIFIPCTEKTVSLISASNLFYIPHILRNQILLKLILRIRCLLIQLVMS